MKYLGGWFPQMYPDYLRSRDARPLKGVFYHNEIDILSLAALLDHMADLLESLPKEGLLPIMIKSRSPGSVKMSERLSGRRLSIDTAWIARCWKVPGLKPCIDCHYIHKRAGNYEEALVLWRAGC